MRYGVIIMMFNILFNTFIQSDAPYQSRRWAEAMGQGMVKNIHVPSREMPESLALLPSWHRHDDRRQSELCQVVSEVSTGGELHYCLSMITVNVVLKGCHFGYLLALLIIPLTRNSLLQGWENGRVPPGPGLCALCQQCTQILFCIFPTKYLRL